MWGGRPLTVSQLASAAAAINIRGAGKRRPPASLFFPAFQLSVHLLIDPNQYSRLIVRPLSQD
jgi:hypothetical protein